MYQVVKRKNAQAEQITEYMYRKKYLRTEKSKNKVFRGAEAARWTSFPFPGIGSLQGLYGVAKDKKRDNQGQ
ncbi:MULTISPECIES: hypothetical protein [unclassified Anabaena]|uniref:hypothetical protein n=1 Tax=unclassified Anabaena TaxID=2619674 RepID=UPI0039C66E20